MPAVMRILPALGAIIVIGALDASVAPRFPFTPFYGVVIAFAAWQIELRPAVAVAVAAGMARFVSELRWHGADAFAAWNGLAWTAVFVALAQLVVRARGRAEETTTLQARVSELIQVEHSLARTDPLTSLCNRRAFIDALQQAQARSRRGGGVLAVARLDVDGFHRLNETYSHADGDQLLRGIATSLALTTRMGDLAARLENDEFAIMLYDCGPEDAQRVAQRLVTEVVELGRAYPESRITASVGVACFAAPGPDPDEMMRLAGSALHRARQAGGNTAIVERGAKPDVRQPAN